MKPATRTSVLLLIAAVVVQALVVAGIRATSRRPDFGWFAYAPMRVADYSASDPLLSDAYPGAVAVALGVAFTVVVALTRRWTAAVVLAAAAAASALSASPGLSTPVGSAGIRLAVLLAPGLLVLAIRRWTSGSWPWRFADPAG